MPGGHDAIGVDLGGTKIEALRLDATGRERWRRRVPTPAGDYAATLDAIGRLVGAARAIDPAPCSIGFGTPGSAGPGGLMRNCNSTCLNGRPLRRDLEARLGQPVTLANDANCLALSEATDGAGAGAAVVFAVIVGTGTGAGIAVHGSVLEGANGLAGEWGHGPLPWAGDDERDIACWCGRRGCIEALVSGPALAADHARRHGGALTAEQIASSATTGHDADCLATLERHADRLARALAGVINLLDPDVIVLGGGLSRMAHLYAQLPPRWPRWVFGGGPLRTRLAPALHGDSSGVRGAAWLGREQPSPARPT